MTMNKASKVLGTIKRSVGTANPTAFFYSAGFFKHDYVNPGIVQIFDLVL